MAEIIPFRGILYRPADASQPDVSAELAPPYDVINEAQRVALADKSAHNAVRLILPRDRSGGDSDEKYSAAAETLRGWMGQGVMVRDAVPALYRYHQVFRAPGAAAEQAAIVRRGLVARIRLHRFDEGVVLPHERTLAGPKLDRLKLKRATRTHLSQVFGLFDDAQGAVDAHFAQTDARPCELRGVTDDGVEHRLWRLTDAQAIEAVAQELRDKPIYIADGHHRYETMLALRDEWRKEAGYCGLGSAAEYGSIFLCNARDPGLVVFPTHRVLHSVEHFDLNALLEGLAPDFFVQELGELPGVQQAKQVLAESGLLGPSLLLCSGARAVLLRVRPDAQSKMAGPKVLHALDVTVLHALVLEQALRISRAAQESQANLRYLKDVGQALAAVREPGVQAVFLLNPTPVDQVMQVADAGQVMPQKSTYFYPKIASGIVLNPVDPSEPADAVGSLRLPS